MNEKPTSLKVLSGIWFLIGAIELLRCLLSFFNLIGMQISSANDPAPANPSGMMPVMIAGGYAFTVLYTAIATLITVSAIYLWKLRPWARTSLEVVSWIGLVAVVCIGILWMYTFLEMSSHIPELARDQMDWVGWIALALFTVGSTAHGVSIGVLRSRKVRDAIAAARQNEASIADSEHRLPYEVPSLPRG